MLFFTRAFVCIGLVVALAEGVNVASFFHEAGSQGQRVVDRGASQVKRVCSADPSRCLSVAAAAVAAGHRADGMLDGGDRPTSPPASKDHPARRSGAGQGHAAN